MMKLPLVVLVLSLSLAEGTLLSKCGLKERLEEAISQLPEEAKAKGLTKDTLVAKIVCYVEMMSGFNTSAVTTITPPGDRNHGRGRRSIRRPPGPPRPPRPTRPTGPLGLTRPTGPPRPTRPTRPQHPNNETWTLFGVFQLSNHLVCSDGMTPSPNICQVDCDELLDDDIDNDINCLLQIFTNLLKTGFGGPHWQELKQTMRLLYPDQCRDKQASSYFDGCN